MGQLKIDLLGINFSIRADNGNDEYLQKLLGYYERIAEDVQESGVKNPLQVAILAGINLCDELYKEKEAKIAMENGVGQPAENSFDNAEIERMTKQMIQAIDKVL